MTSYTIRNPDYKERVTADYNQQAIMTTFGASIRHIEAGIVELEIPFQQALTQQHGFFHAGITTTMMDNACGYAALTLFPADMGVLTIEFKVNFLAPAVGTTLIARGVVAKSGRTITVCNGEALMVQSDGRLKPVAQIVATLMAVPEEPSTTN